MSIVEKLLKKEQIKELDEDILNELEDAIIKISKENIEKCKICV